LRENLIKEGQVKARMLSFTKEKRRKGQRKNRAQTKKRTVPCNVYKRSGTLSKIKI
jgi:hypothetical protein